MIDTLIGKPLVPTKLVPSSMDSRDCPHTVLVVGRRSADETWVVDASGCQYGFREVLVPYEKYIADKECELVNGLQAYDATETKDLDYFATLPFMNATRAQRAGHELERQARLHFASFVDTGVDKDVLLNGSTADVKAAFDRFEAELRSHMLEFSNRKSRGSGKKLRA